jgi:peptidoglycan/LPS O-acetylase OafA/YrhL
MNSLLNPSPNPALILPTALPKPNSVDALLLLRAFACLMVIIYHCGPPRNSIQFQGVDLSWLMFSNGAVAVWIFFCLSGYLMGKAFYSGRYDLSWPSVINFWRNRALRIIPLYSFNILLLSIFVYPEILRPGNWGILLHLFTFTYNPTSSPPIAINGFVGFVVWTISTEFQFYLLVPALYAIAKRYALKQQHIWLAIAAIILTIFSLKFAIWIVLNQEIANYKEYAFTYWYIPLATNLDIFLVGFLMNPLLRTFQQQPESYNSKSWKVSQISVFIARFRKPLTLVLVLLLFLFTAHHQYYQELSGAVRAATGIRTTTTLFILQPVTALVTACFILAFESGSSTNPYTKLSCDIILQNPLRLLEAFGHLSYGVYLWHLPIIEKITPIFTSTIPIEAFYLRLQATLFLSLILSIITYYSIEAPTARWKIYR